MKISWILILTACGGSHDVPPATGDAAPLLDGTSAPIDAPYVDPTFGEVCGNGVDDDGDGLVDEDCSPSLFAGVFAPSVATDPALAAIEGATHRPLAVLQTYHSTQPAGVDKIGADLAAIFARGQVAHLNMEPSGYTPAQYAAPTAPPLSSDLAAMGAQVASALASSQGRVLLTFGAEMNGNWTDWGCLPAATYIVLYRAAHDAVDQALASAQVDPRRVRWAYGPNATASTSCGSASGYYPGAAYVDLLGMSAYRMDGTTVAQSVTEPMAALYAGTGATQRFVVLQTGARAASDRDSWAQQLFAVATADSRMAGIIWFDAADWAVPTAGNGWTGLTGAIAAAPVSDALLDGVFAPHFADVAYGTPGYNEIQTLADNKLTSGCATAPARFCPDDPLTRRAAAILLAKGFQLPELDTVLFSDVPATDPGFSAIATLAVLDPEIACGPNLFCPDDPIKEADLVAIIARLHGQPVSGGLEAATRARGAVLIAHGARLGWQPTF